MHCAVSIVVVLVWCLWALPADAQNCRKVRTNLQGVAGADITVGATATTVLAQNTSRCEAIINNVSVNDMRCADVTNNAPPTATTGVVVQAGKTLQLSLEGQAAWQCIRAGSADAVASVAESLP